MHICFHLSFINGCLDWPSGPSFFLDRLPVSVSAPAGQLIRDLPLSWECSMYHLMWNESQTVNRRMKFPRALCNSVIPPDSFPQSSWALLLASCIRSMVSMIFLPVKVIILRILMKPDPTIDIIYGLHFFINNHSVYLHFVITSLSRTEQPN